MPPIGFPDWLWTILSVVLPLCAPLLRALPGFTKWLISWGLASIVVIFVGLVFRHYTIPELIANLAWVLAAMQAVYQLLKMSAPGYVKGPVRPQIGPGFANSTK